METYNGHVRTPADAIILFEACRIGLLPRVQRRLSEKERQSIKSGSVFVWDEREAGMRRWTDGKSWSASRVSGSFLTYREMEGKRGGSSFDKNANRDGIQNNDGDSDGGPDGYRYKPDGLMKQSFSITTNSGQHLHLISYFSRASAATQNLIQPSNDTQLRHIRPEKGMYPESTVHEQSTIPAVTRGPMSSPGYTHSPHQPSPYARAAPYAYSHHPGYMPPSPMHTPPGYPGHPPYYQQTGPYPGQSPLQNMQYPPPPAQAGYGPPPPMTNFDRPPPPMSNNGLPPPHPQQYGPPPPNGYPQPYGYSNGYHGYQPPPIQQQHQPPYPPHHAQQPQPYHLSRPQQQPESAAYDAPRRDERSDSYPSQHAQQPYNNGGEQPAQAGAPAPPTSGQTIPSISSMLNGEGQGPSPRSNSRNSGGSPRPLQDIPASKLGFEATRDVHTLRNLDKSTLKY